MLEVVVFWIDEFYRGWFLFYVYLDFALKAAQAHAVDGPDRTDNEQGEHDGQKY